MGGHKDRRSPLFFLQDQFHKLVLHQRVQPARWFIQYVEIRRIHECTYDADLLFHSLGHFFDPASRVQRKHIHEFLHPALILHAFQVCGEFKKLLSRHIIHKCDLSRQIAKRSVNILCFMKTVHSIDHTGSVIRSGKSKKVTDRRSLSSTVGAEESHHFSLFYRK